MGVFTPKELPESFRVCIENITPFLPKYGCDVTCHDSPNVLKSADVIWDPRAGAGSPPHPMLVELDLPLVVTLHGVGPLAFPKFYSKGPLQRFWIHQSNGRKRKLWQSLYPKCARIVTVSHFSKKSIIEHLDLPAEKIDVIHNGINRMIFKKTGPYLRLIQSGTPYFLHISNDEPRKNVKNILKAYRKMKCENKWPLILKLSGSRRVNIRGVHLISQRLTDTEIASLYRFAGAFVFPSFYEGFGLPIAEAMATGCAVITSKDTACEEIGGEAVMLVDPSSVSELSSAMTRILDDCFRNELINIAFSHADKFGWDRAAKCYAKIFKESRYPL